MTRVLVGLHPLDLEGGQYNVRDLATPIQAQPRRRDLRETFRRSRHDRSHDPQPGNAAGRRGTLDRVPTSFTLPGDPQRGLRGRSSPKRPRKQMHPRLLLCRDSRTDAGSRPALDSCTFDVPPLWSSAFEAG
jgi:hypothetical protein